MAKIYIIMRLDTTERKQMIYLVKYSTFAVATCDNKGQHRVLSLLARKANYGPFSLMPTRRLSVVWFQ